MSDLTRSRLHMLDIRILSTEVIVKGANCSRNIVIIACKTRYQGDYSSQWIPSLLADTQLARAGTNCQVPLH